MSQKKERFIALSYRDFRLLWMTQLISIIGSQMQNVAQSWHIYSLTHSPIALGLTGLFTTIPLIIFSLIGGTFADRYDRKKILLISQIAFALLASCYAITTFLGIISPTIIYIITALTAVGSAFNAPAAQAFVPKLVKKEHLTNAMSLNIIMRQTATIIGPAIAGFVIGIHGVGIVYLVNSLSFIGVIIALILIHTDGKVIGSASTTSISAIKEGLQFIKSRTMIWSTMLLDFFSTFFSSATSLLPLFASDILHVGPQGLGILYAAPSVGSVLAGFIFAHQGEIKSQGKILLLAVGIYAIGTILFGISRSFIFSLVALFFIGAGDTVSTIIRNTIRQLETPDNIRGRMTSINMIFFMGGPQLGEFEAGILAASLGGPWSVIIGGVSTLLVVIAFSYYIPHLRDYDSHG